MGISQIEWKQSLRYCLLFNGLLSRIVWVRLWWVYIAFIPSLLKAVFSMRFQAFQSQLTNWKGFGHNGDPVKNSILVWLDCCSRLLSISHLFLFTVTCPTTGSAAWLQICSRDSPTSPNCKPLSFDRDVYWWTKALWLQLVQSYVVGNDVWIPESICLGFRNISGNIFSSLEPNIFQELPSLKLVWVRAQQKST